MHPTIKAGLTPSEQAAIKKVRDVLIVLAAGDTCPFNVARFTKHGLVSYVPGSYALDGSGHPNRQGHGSDCERITKSL
jgi:hypothetical protein